MQSNETTSFIPAHVKLPEITIRAIILSCILTALLGAANAYLGMKIGLTVSASIPAAIISMGILRWFKGSNVLENSIVQTAASSGEALVAGAIFTLPALLALHYWTDFNYLETVVISLIGGIFGIVFSVPLRRIMITDKDLKFPEGVAIAGVLKISADTNVSMKPLLLGSLFGGLISFAQSGIQIFSQSMSYWFVHNERVYGIGFGFSPAMLAAGYIVGIYVAISIIMGMIFAWIFCLPILSHTASLNPHALLDSVMTIWSTKIRYTGVGTMLIGGVWTFITLTKPLVKSVIINFQIYQQKKQSGITERLRTERDIPMRYLNWILIIMVIPLLWFFYQNLSGTELGLSHMMHISTVVAATLICLIFGFILAAVCSYFAGLVGSSSSPISGVTIAIVLITSVIFYLLLHDKVNLHDQKVALRIAADTILVSAIVCTMGAISNDTMQDFKSGHLVGSTPWKQQVMLLVGMLAAALVIPSVLKLLFNAYGMAGILPRPGMDAAQMLSAPQASLMASVASGVFGSKLPWHLIMVGITIGVFAIILDEIARRRNFRLPALALGMGIYLPFDVTSTIAVGGLLSYFAQRKAKQHKNTALVESKQQNATMLACGLVAGSALMGVILAIPFVILKSSDALNIMPHSLAWLAEILGVFSLVALLHWLYKTATKD